jgi:hypothetical protein
VTGSMMNTDQIFDIKNCCRKKIYHEKWSKYLIWSEWKKTVEIITKKRRKKESMYVLYFVLSSLLHLKRAFDRLKFETH